MYYSLVTVEAEPVYTGEINRISLFIIDLVSNAVQPVVVCVIFFNDGFYRCFLLGVRCLVCSSDSAGCFLIGICVSGEKR